MYRYSCRAVRTAIFSGIYGSASSRLMYIVTNRHGGKTAITGPLVKLIKLNNLQINPDRGPEACRRSRRRAYLYSGAARGLRLDVLEHEWGKNNGRFV